MTLTMESAFLELYQQFKMLQAVCSRQAQLLQRLLSKDVKITEMPMSKPIQCTDAEDPISSQNSLFGQKEPEAPLLESTTSMTKDPYQPLVTKDNSTFSFDCDIRLPPCQHNFQASPGNKSELAKPMSHTDVSLDETEVNGNFALFIKTYAPTLAKASGVGDKTIPAMSDIDFLAKDPDSRPNFSDIDELCFLRSKDILEPQINDFSAIRGPDKTSWHPESMLEECHHGHHVDNISDVVLSSQICDFCLAVFPAGVATEAEYLQHLTTHLE